MLKKRRTSTYKAPVIVHANARKEILKFVDQYQFISDAARELGCSYSHLYMMMNGFSWPSQKMADKMETISSGYVKSEKMVREKYLK